MYPSYLAAHDRHTLAKGRAEPRLGGTYLKGVGYETQSDEVGIGNLGNPRSDTGLWVFGNLGRIL